MLRICYSENTGISSDYLLYCPSCILSFCESCNRKRNENRTKCLFCSTNLKRVPGANAGSCCGGNNWSTNEACKFLLLPPHNSAQSTNLAPSINQDGFRWGFRGNGVQRGSPAKSIVAVENTTVYGLVCGPKRKTLSPHLVVEYTSRTDNHHKVTVPLTWYATCDEEEHVMHSEFSFVVPPYISVGSCKLILDTKNTVIVLTQPIIPPVPPSTTTELFRHIPMFRHMLRLPPPENNTCDALEVLNQEVHKAPSKNVWVILGLYQDSGMLYRMYQGIESRRHLVVHGFGCKINLVQMVLNAFSPGKLPPVVTCDPSDLLDRSDKDLEVLHVTRNAHKMICEKIATALNLSEKTEHAIVQWCENQRLHQVLESAFDPTWVNTVRYDVTVPVVDGTVLSVFGPARTHPPPLQHFVAKLYQNVIEQQVKKSYEVPVNPAEYFVDSKLLSLPLADQPGLLVVIHSLENFLKHKDLFRLLVILRSTPNVRLVVTVHNEMNAKPLFDTNGPPHCDAHSYWAPTFAVPHWYESQEIVDAPTVLGEASNQGSERNIDRSNQSFAVLQVLSANHKKIFNHIVRLALLNPAKKIDGCNST
eukprot:PhF_6_TR4426/c0_g1_i1/m.5988